MKNIRNFPQFTHFASLPFIREQYRYKIKQLNKKIIKTIQNYYPNDLFKQSNPKLAHITVSMLTLHRQQTRNQIKIAMQQLKQNLFNSFKNTSVTFNKIGYFTRFDNKSKRKQVTLIYLQLQNNKNLVNIVKGSDIFIRGMIKYQIIANNQLKHMRLSYDHNSGIYKNQHFHLTLFRVNNVIEDQKFQFFFKQITNIFQPITMECDMFDISTRNKYDGTNFYQPFHRIQLQNQ